MVSASGSSGMALQLPPADVAAVLLPLELDRLGGGAAALCGALDRRCDRGDGEHAPSRRDEPTVAQLRPRVEDDDVVSLCDVRRDLDRLPLFVRARVAGRGEDGGE